jgi:hypothetical protein
MLVVSMIATLVGVYYVEIIKEMFRLLLLKEKELHVPLILQRI